ncbi:hypothetical protein OS242_01885 [Tumebacillus sp. DT12]|uniref:Uncharacterized protein n=1 Tax=Tumebacillus lacus TaxID=2995335 RepID=A0ABT3WZL3_9BACL|nr:hypothetical protein [Tumebacillus lacus]MCX7568720.1 hypothetical protein [Tumebacillus lacus]
MYEGKSVKQVTEELKMISEQFSESRKAITESIRATSEQINRAFEPINEGLQNIAQQIDQSWRQPIIKMLGSIVFFPDLTELAERLQESAGEYESIMDAYPVAMVALGWPPDLNIPMPMVPEVVEIYNDKPIDEAKGIVSKMIVDFYDDEEVIKLIISTWGKYEWLAHRYPILEDSVNAHLEGKYNLSIPAMLPHFEGVVVDWAQKVGKMQNGELKEYILSMKLNNKRDRFLVEIQKFFIEKLLEGFEHGAQLSEPLSRHAILHGADWRYGTKENSLKVVLFFDCVIDSISRLRENGVTANPRPKKVRERSHKSKNSKVRT